MMEENVWLSVPDVEAKLLKKEKAGLSEDGVLR